MRPPLRLLRRLPPLTLRVFPIIHLTQKKINQLNKFNNAFFICFVVPASGGCDINLSCRAFKVSFLFTAFLIILSLSIPSNISKPSLISCGVDSTIFLH